MIKQPKLQVAETSRNKFHTTERRRILGPGYWQRRSNHSGQNPLLESKFPDTEEQPLVQVELVEIRGVASQHHQQSTVRNVYLPVQQITQWWSLTSFPILY